MTCLGNWFNAFCVDRCASSANNWFKAGKGVLKSVLGLAGVVLQIYRAILKLIYKNKKLTMKNIANTFNFDSNVNHQILSALKDSNQSSSGYSLVNTLYITKAIINRIEELIIFLMLSIELAPFFGSGDWI